MSDHIFVWTDINYYCIATPHEYHLDVRVYKVYEDAATDKDGGLWFERKDGRSSADLATSTEDAQVYLSGSLKWDGCSNLNFDEQDDVMLHFCGRGDLKKMTTMLERLYDLAAELIPAADAEMMA